MFGPFLANAEAAISSRRSKANDVTILIFALTLEFLEAEFYRQAVKNNAFSQPCEVNALPGWAAPTDPWSYPGKDEVADYLDAYAKRFELPVITGAKVDQVSRTGDSYLVRARAHRFEAEDVVVASGTFQEPVAPELAAELDPRVREMHSSEYRNPGQLQPGPVRSRFPSCGGWRTTW